MRALYRKLTARCVQCGQKLDSNHSATTQATRVNKRFSDSLKTLTRTPMVQNCRKCQRIIFEGEPGFVQRCLLTDIA